MRRSSEVMAQSFTIKEGGVHTIILSSKIDLCGNKYVFKVKGQKNVDVHQFNGVNLLFCIYLKVPHVRDRENLGKVLDDGPCVVELWNPRSSVEHVYNSLQVCHLFFLGPRDC